MTRELILVDLQRYNTRNKKRCSNYGNNISTYLSKKIGKLNEISLLYLLEKTNMNLYGRRKITQR